MNPAISVYRTGNWFYRKNLKKIANIFSYINRLFFSVWLPSSVSIGKNFILGYGGLGTVIHSDTKIGNNVSIDHNVTIGRNPKDSKVPTIGDDVYIATGSVIIGEISVGNNVIIGANSLINKSVPDNCTVVGNPFRIIEKDRSMKYYELDVNLQKVVLKRKI